MPKLFILAAISFAVYYFFFRENSPKNDTKQTSIPETTETVETTSPAVITAAESTEAVARPVATQPAKKYTESEKLTIKSLYTKAKLAFKEADLITAKENTEQVLKLLNENSSDWKNAAELLGRINIAIFTTGYMSPDKTIHTVKRGDSLDKIAKQYHTTLKALQNLNGIPPTSSTIRLGQSITAFKGNWSIKISKSKYRLYLYNNSKLFKFYNVGTGRNNKTPEGTFEVADKIKEPTWEYNGKKYAFGSKENVLGTRWMKLRATGVTPDYQGYGIHGTWAPQSIGKMSSNGCIRMKNEDVEELYSILPKYSDTNGLLTSVTIEK